MQLRGIQFVLMPNRWIIIEVNLFRRQICGCGEITLFESIIFSPPQPQPFWLILTSKLWRITASSLFSFLLFFYSVKLTGLSSRLWDRYKIFIQPWFHNHFWCFQDYCCSCCTKVSIQIFGCSTGCFYSFVVAADLGMMFLFICRDRHQGYLCNYV